MDAIQEKELNALSREVIGSCIDIHKTLGPGLLESIYLDLLCFDLGLKGISCEKEKELHFLFKGNVFNTQLRADLIVENKLLIELKSVVEMHPIFTAQIMTYLRLTNIELGLLINFNVPLLKEGIHRIRLDNPKQLDTLALSETSNEH